MYERCKAKTSGGHSQQEDGAVAKLGSVWNHGVYLGVNRKTGEIAVGVKSGVFTTRTVRRKPIDDRCKPAAMELIISVPWRTNEEDPRADGDPFEALHMPEDAARRHEDEVQKERELAHESVPRYVITKKDMEQHSDSARCLGCASVIGGMTRQAHSTECRKRFS